MQEDTFDPHTSDIQAAFTFITAQNILNLVYLTGPVKLMVIHFATTD